MTPAAEERWPSEAYGWLVTITLLVGFTFSFIDRQVLNLLVEPIQADLGISDTEISFLQGFAFVITYVAMSIPLGRLVDRYNRIHIMIGGVLFWSATTVACGLSRTYGQLLAARMGVGAGEATLAPAAWSVLSDYFRPHRLARPMSVYLMGPYLGAGRAMIAGAEVLDWTRQMDTVDTPFVGELAPWQFTFVVVGVPGILIAGMIALLREPVRKGRTADLGAVPNWRTVWGFVWRQRRIYAALHLGVPFIVVILYGLQAWVPTILVRVFEWDLADAGRRYGVIALLTGSAGVLTGPFIASWLRRRGHVDAPLRVGVIGAIAAPCCLVGLPWLDSGNLALVAIAGASFSVTLPLALITTTMQEVTPNDMRGVVAGMYVVTTNVMGLALGPTLVAASTDFLFQDPQAVAKSLALVSVCMGPVAALLLWLGAKPYAMEKARMEGDA